MATREAQHRKIPRCMSTQHPDNVSLPFFATNSVVRGAEEVKEAYYVFSHLGCDEQMWDYEGKEVDDLVVYKLLAEYEPFFKEHILGQDLFLTLRIPNPGIEKEMRKILVETLESIPRSFDIASTFYGYHNPPIFEVILPMTTSAKDLDRIYHFYKNFVVGKQSQRISEGDIFVWEWVGKFLPEEIQVIPLVEDLEYMLRVDEIVEAYLKDKNAAYLRVFLARSDLALNYGLLTAVLANKIALYKLRLLEQRLSIPIYPIIGVGSAPFRGNFKPHRVRQCLREFPSVQTFTIQSAFKYDYPTEMVREALEVTKVQERGEPVPIEEGRAMEIIRKCSQEYRRQVANIAGLVNRVAPLVPQRRDRRLHIGLFGYSRQAGEVSLPRAIPFCASLYSLGLPPEFMGLKALDRQDLSFVKAVYTNFLEDLRDASRYRNEANISALASDFWPRLLDDEIAESEPQHAKLSSRILEGLRNQDHTLDRLVVEAAYIRRFLG